MSAGGRAGLLPGPIQDEPYGVWLAAWADCEGSFNIGRRGRLYGCTFSIQMRADERPLFEEALAVTGLGGLSLRAPSKNCPNPCLNWSVAALEHLAVLVDCFDRFPLRSKKRHDYAIWRQAVREQRLLSMSRPGWFRDSSRMRELKRQLEEGRRFGAPPPDIPFVGRAIDFPQQERLF